MIDDAGVSLVRETLVLMLLISAPVLAAGIVVGLVLSLVQSVTSIQDQTLTFVPKIVAMVLVVVVLMPWIAVKLAEYAAAAFMLF